MVGRCVWERFYGACKCWGLVCVSGCMVGTRLTTAEVFCARSRDSLWLRQCGEGYNRFSYMRQHRRGTGSNPLPTTHERLTVNTGLAEGLSWGLVLQVLRLNCQYQCVGYLSCPIYTTTTYMAGRWDRAPGLWCTSAWPWPPRYQCATIVSMRLCNYLFI